MMGVMVNHMAYEWRFFSDELVTTLPEIARMYGTLHLSYDLTRDLWTVANDAGYAALRARAVEELRAVLADDQEADHA